MRNPRAGLIHHSDRGGQYAGKKYRGVLERAESCQSMSRADSCYDNAFMESCFGTIKTELEMEYYENEHQARRDLCRSAEVTRLCSGKLTHYLEKKIGWHVLFSK